jgi:hypothetical protein
MFVSAPLSVLCMYVVSPLYGDKPNNKNGRTDWFAGTSLDLKMVEQIGRLVGGPDQIR